MYTFIIACKTAEDYKQSLISEREKNVEIKYSDTNKSVCVIMFYHSLLFKA